MASRSKSKSEGPAVRISGEVTRRIRQHARSQSKTEVCGVLVGRENEGRLEIDACIAGVNAAQAGSHVTFTQDTWEHIYKVKDSEYPDDRIVGWYHSHPGFGVFLSDHDTFIHKNFFSAPQQVAWVYDPHSDEEGCFGWVGPRLERLVRISVTDHKGGEEAGETGKPEPVGGAEIDLDEDIDIRNPEQRDRRSKAAAKEVPAWLDWTFSILSHVLIFVLGGLLALFLLHPKTEVYVMDRTTGRLAGPVPAEIVEQLHQEAQRQMMQGGDQGAAGATVPPADGKSDGKKGANGQSGK